jgi:hypothetical protein
MPWPKGKPRTGYVKKDGTKAKSWGSRTTSAGMSAAPTRQTTKRTIRRVDPSVLDATSAATLTPPKLHGDRAGRSVIEPCPNCMFAYADGGYCEECGWSKPVKMGRVS